MKNNLMKMYLIGTITVLVLSIVFFSSTTKVLADEEVCKTFICKVTGIPDPLPDEEPFCGDWSGEFNVANGVNTAFGCIRLFDADLFSGSGGADYSIFLSWILTWAIGLGGGIAFLLIIYAGFMIMTSSGDPERLKAGQELLTSAIMGLIMLIFSVFTLEFIGVDILGLPGFGT